MEFHFDLVSDGFSLKAVKKKESQRKCMSWNQRRKLSERLITVILIRWKLVRVEWEKLLVVTNVHTQFPACLEVRSAM